MVALPTVGHADETAADPVLEPQDYYSGLEDLSLRRSIAGVGHFYFIPPPPVYSKADIPSQDAYIDAGGGSAGGYVSFGSPPASGFLGAVAGEKDESWIDGVEFGVDWRPEVGGLESHDFRRSAGNFSGAGMDRIGVRADLTALFYDEAVNDAGSSAWRLTGMLGSTSLSLLSEYDGASLTPGRDGGGLLWDIGVGWSSGAMSVNAGYRSVHGFNEAGEEGSAIATLSLGADFAVLPGLSVYGELNVMDGPPDDNEDGRGAAVIVGAGVGF
jgi:hypothetical protein